MGLLEGEDAYVFDSFERWEIGDGVIRVIEPSSETLLLTSRSCVESSGMIAELQANAPATSELRR